MMDRDDAIPRPSNRDWTEDFSHENGNYTNTCVVCGERFNGGKYRRVCKICSCIDQEAGFDTNKELEDLSEEMDKSGEKYLYLSSEHLDPDAVTAFNKFFGTNSAGYVLKPGQPVEGVYPAIVLAATLEDRQVFKELSLQVLPDSVSRVIVTVLGTWIREGYYEE